MIEYDDRPSSLGVAQLEGHFFQALVLVFFGHGMRPPTRRLSQELVLYIVKKPHPSKQLCRHIRKTTIIYKYSN